MTEQEVATQPRTGLTIFGITDEALRELVKKYEKFPDPAAGPDEYQAVVDAVKEIRDLRGDVERSRREKKANIIRDGKLIDGEANRIKDILFGIENPMKDAKLAVDTEKELIEQKRVAVIDSKIRELTVTNIDYGISVETLEQMLEHIKSLPIDETFDEFYHDAEQAKQKSLSLLAQTLKSKQDEVAQKQALEDQRLAQQDEQSRLDALRVERDAEQRLADEARVKEDKRLRGAAERIAAERKQLDQEKEATAAAVQAKQDAEAEEKRLADLEPDKKKLKALAKDLSRYSFPSVKSEAAEQILMRVIVKLGLIADDINRDLGDMK